MVLAWAACRPGFGETEVTLKGRLLEKGTRNPLAGVNIFVLPAKLKTTTDAEGNFSLSGVPEGEFQWVINFANYDRLEKSDVQKAADPNEDRVFYLKRQNYEVYETTVYAQGEKKEPRKRTLSPREFTKSPGSFGDPVKAVQNLPGVARPSPLTSRVSIEGSAPQDTKYLIDGHEIPLIFHFGGLTSVVFPETLERVDFLASGYGPENSRALGGIIGAGTRPGRTDKFHGLAFADLIQAGVLFELPIGKGSLSFGGRRSYVGDVLKLVAGKNNANFDLAVAPSYGDLIAVYDTPLSDRDQLKVVGIGSQDALKFLFDSPVSKDAAGRGAFSNNTSFYRFIPQWTRKHSEDLTTRLSLGAGQDFFRVDILDNYFELKQTSLSLRGEIEYRVMPEWTFVLGTDDRHTSPVYTFQIPDTGAPGAGGGSGPGGGGGVSTGTGAKLQSKTTPQATELGFFLRNTVAVPETPLTLLPSVRLDHFNVSREWIFEPRLGARYALDESTNLRTSVGLYAQAPQPQQTDPTIGNPDLRSEKAWHWTLGMEKDFRQGGTRGFLLSTDAFYKTMHSLVISTSALTTRNGTVVPERFNNAGTGLAYGISSSLKYDAKPWYASLSYTLSRSTRYQPDRGNTLFQNDQTHILVAMAQVDLGNDWSIGSRLRFVSGNPFTPVAEGIFSSDADRYLRLRGPYFSQRLDAFFALDVRVDKKWVYDTWILSAYLDVQNLTNNANSEQISYSYDFKRSGKVTGLPVFPTLGIKGEF